MDLLESATTAAAASAATASFQSPEKVEKKRRTSVDGGTSFGHNHIVRRRRTSGAINGADGADTPAPEPQHPPLGQSQPQQWLSPSVVAAYLRAIAALLNSPPPTASTTMSVMHRDNHISDDVPNNVSALLFELKFLLDCNK